MNEELLSKIQEDIDLANSLNQPTKGLRVLYEVAQLHIPVPNMSPTFGTKGKIESFIPEFSTSPGCSCSFYVFPCPTFNLIYSKYN